MSAESESADVFDFVDAYLSDLERGVDRPLTYWLERFPRSTEAVAREWVSLREPRRDAVAHASGASGSFEDGTARIGPYKLLRELGRGGQGTVFLAEDSRIARRVALKALTSRFDSITDEKRLRFRREAEVIARLEHPGLCTIHDADLDGDSPWIAMRFVEGRTLGECLAEAKQKGGAEVFGLRLPPTNATELHAVLYLVERAARALHAAHEAGVVHRDVKPGNVIVALDGRPVVLDFGLARDETSDTGTLTQSGDVFGTPAYMSPEQLTSASSELDRRTDVYSLGALAYEALTLERPFDHASRTELYRAILEAPLPDPRKKNSILTEDVCVVLETAMEKDRARRYATALELAEDLRRIREYEPIHARPASVGLRFARWTRRHPAIAAATLGTILALSIGLAVSLKLLADERAALRHALGRQLALRAEALSLEDPPAALAVGLEAIERAETDLTRGSLFTALDACWLAHYVELDGDSDGGMVTAIATSPSEPIGVVAMEGGLVFFVDLDSGRHVGDLRARGSSPTADVRFSPDGGTLALSCADGTLELVDRRGQVAPRSENCGTGAPRAEFSPDGRHLVVVGGDGRLRFVERPAETEKTAPSATTESLEAAESIAAARTAEAAAPIGDADEFERAVFAPDGARVLALSKRRGLVVFDARERRVVREWNQERVVAFDVASDDDRTVAFLSCADRRLRLVDLETGDELAASTPIEGDVERVVAGPRGQSAIVIVAQGEEGWAYRYERAGGTVRRLAEHGGRRVTQAKFSPDGRRLATASWDTTVRVWDAETGAHVRACMVPRRQLDVSWSHDGERFLTRTNGGSPQIWFGRLRPDLFDLEGHEPGRAITSVTFLSDGRRVVSASEDATARIWNVDPDEPAKLGRALATLRHEGAIRSVELADLDRIVFTVSDDASVGVWDGANGHGLRARAAHPAPILGAAFDPHGARFVTWCADGLTRLWSTRTDAAPLVLGETPREVSCACFSLDGDVLVLGGAEDTLVLYDARTGAPTRRAKFDRKKAAAGGFALLRARANSDEIVAACGDGFVRRLALGSASDFDDERKSLSILAEDMSLDRSGRFAVLRSRFGRGAVSALDLASGRGCSPLVSHSADLTDACFSDDGGFVMTTSHDGTARVWRVEGFAPFARRGGFAGSVTCGDLHGVDGSVRAVTGTSQGRVSVWPIDPAPAAAARRPRGLTPAQRRLEAELASPLEFR